MQLSVTPVEVIGWKLKSDNADVDDANTTRPAMGGLRCLS
jgi:hypothetical protein